MNLADYGYNERWERIFNEENVPGTQPARVIAQHKAYYTLATGDGERRAQVAGKYRNRIEEDYPAVGDWVCARVPTGGDASIDATLPRMTRFKRLDGWHNLEQTLAANIDTALLCMSLNDDYSIARIERYLALGRESGSSCAVLLTKSDLMENHSLLIEQARAVSGGIPVHVVSALTGENIDALAPYFAKATTVAAVGSSGVGKSTLVNALFGSEIMRTAEVREDDSKGRHTTVHRQIVRLPSGGLYLDMPGIREVGLVDAVDGLNDTFADIALLAGKCRFSDCRHDREPGCAVTAAVGNGDLDAARLRRYNKLRREAEHHARKHR